MYYTENKSVLIRESTTTKRDAKQKQENIMQNIESTYVSYKGNVIREGWEEINFLKLGMEDYD